jgi:guanosine-3',5'-bis(diphosphate) 3'-pyrophosphohydrolase
MTLINEAFEIAAAAHAGQTRKHSNIPYIIHPLRVADAIGPINETLTSAALLHDVLEDAPERVDEGHIRSRIVLGIVKELTRTDDPTNTTDKEAYLASFAGKSVEALIIKLFDRYDNVADFARTSPSYAPKYAGKAAILYTIVIRRADEVKAYAGEDFANRMVAIALMLKMYADGTSVLKLGV